MAEPRPPGDPCNAVFRYRTSVVFQLQITRHMTAAPIVRDYMVDGERGLSVARRIDAG